MTSVTASRLESRSPSTTTGPQTGTGSLVRLILRRDRVKLPAWIAGLGLFVAYIGSALPTIAPTPEDLAALVPMLEQPVGRMFTGPAYGMDDPTYERFFAAGYLPYLFLLTALMSVLLVIRHTRAEEESGRAELVRAGVVGRHAHLTAALVVAVLANLAVLVVVTGLAVATGFATTGSLLAGVAAALVGLAFAGVTAVTAQLSEHGRSASGMAGAVLGAAFLLRALGDMAAVGGSALSWASPLGWATQSAPYVLDRWWPLLLLALLCGAGFAVGFSLQGRRDLGAGLLATPHGPGRASAALGTPLGLAARLQLGPLAGWGVAIVLLGVVDGSFTQVMIDAIDDMPPLMVDVFGTDALVDGYLAFLATLIGYVTAAYVVFSIQGLRAEETAGRGEAVLATSTSRLAWAGAHLTVVAAGAVTILVVTGAATGVAAAAVTGDWSHLWTVVLAHLNVVPALLFVVGVCGLLFGWLPGLMTPIGWALIAVMVVVGNFADLLDLPDWLRQLSPLSHPAPFPVEEISPAPLLWLTALALLGIGLGLVGLRRRQIYAS